MRARRKGEKWFSALLGELLLIFAPPREMSCLVTLNFCVCDYSRNPLWRAQDAILIGPVSFPGDFNARAREFHLISIPSDNVCVGQLFFSMWGVESFISLQHAQKR